MLEVSIEWIKKKDLAESNADAVLTSLALSVGVNVHLIAGKQIGTNQVGSQIILH